MNFRPEAGGLEPMVINARYRILGSRWGCVRVIRNDPMVKVTLESFI